MKKILLLSTAVIMSGVSAMAQSTTAVEINQLPNRKPVINAVLPTENPIPLGLTTKDGDTVRMFSHVYNTDTLFTWGYLGGGYLSGTNKDNLNAYAEKYFFLGNDSTAKIVGTVSVWVGHVSASNTQTINFKVWKTDAPSTIGTKFYNAGLPGATLGSVSAKWTDLAMPSSSYMLTTKYFSAPLSPIGTSTKGDSVVYVGYELVGHTWGTTAPGDSIAVVTTLRRASGSYLNNQRYYSVGYITSTADTVLTNQNVYRIGTTWNDFWNGTSIATNFLMAPVFIVKYTTGMAGIQRNDLSFYGNYPNPAVNNTNVKFALKNAADLTIAIYDMSGRVVKTEQLPNMSAGEHVQSLDVSNLSTGTYTYMLSTSAGDRIASQMTIVK